MDKDQKNKDSLLEILVVVSLILILVVVTIVAINPARHFSQTRDDQRGADLDKLVGSINNYFQSGRSFESLGITAVCGVDSPQIIGRSEVDLEKHLVAEYLDKLPVDPISGDSFDTGYTICINPEGSFTLEAKGENPVVTAIERTESFPL